MKRFIVTAFSVLLCGAILSGQPSAPTDTWPRTIPCRVQDGTNRDLFVMTLGEVETPLADGRYDPLTDAVTLNDGQVRKNYYRDVLGVKYFQPIDKTRFPLPPSGWCSWYYYYQQVSEGEVRRNAAWIAENLKEYGAQYVQVDDGWQAEPHGSRDWTGIHPSFEGGMAALASYIKSLGLVPGIWIAPHGQSNESVVKDNPGVFMFKPDGSSASSSWEGKYLVDPSAPAAHEYLTGLFTRLSNWGYEYFKIDGQTVVMNEFKKTTPFMKIPGDPDDLYRKTIASIRAAIGPDRYLLGCWGIPMEGMGYMNGSRTGGDVVLGWSGFEIALQATMRYYYQHNIAWYADPDVMLLRPPLTLDQARVWATLQGLTGQALLMSDRLTDLSADRVEIMRRVYPAVDIRPLDLFPAGRSKRIWDLKVSHLGRTYDVVGAFNFDEDRSQPVYLNWQELGIAAGRPVHVFDFWNREYLGAWEAGMAVEIPPTSCRVFTLLPATDEPQLISTNRHITQGWVDLVSLSSSDRGTIHSGRSRIIGGDPYELHFAFPRGQNLLVRQASARSPSGDLPVRITNHQGWATIRFESPRTAEVGWQVQLGRGEYYEYPTREPGNLRLERLGLNGVSFKWGAQYYLNAGYQVYLDGNLLGYTPDTSFPIMGLDPDRTYRAEVRSVWMDGTTGPRHQKADREFTLRSLLPAVIPLVGLDPVRISPRAAAVRPLALGGRRYEGGLALRPGSEVEYDVRKLYGAFSAVVGVEDSGSGEGEYECVVLGDGKELWRRGGLKRGGGGIPVETDITGVNRLVLRVSGAESGGRRGETVAWVEAILKQ